MRINELLENIKNSEFELEVGLDVKKYLPIEFKKAIANGIIYDCTDDSEGAIKIYSLDKYMSYVRHMIIHHTNLDYTDRDYDILCSTEYNDSNLLNAIMDCFKNDAKECAMVLDLMMDDYMREGSIEFAVSKLLNRLTESIGDVIDLINNKIEELDLKSMLPDDVDVKQLIDFVEKYNK